MISFKEQCIELRKQDLSLDEIAEIMGRSRSSIYFHISSIPLSEKRTAAYQQKATERILQHSTAKKGRSTNSFRTFDEWTSRRVLLVAHLMFDGGLSDRYCAYNNRNEVLIERVKELMTEIYDIEPHSYVNDETGVHRITYNNVALCAFLRSKQMELLTNIRILSIDLKRLFLKAFFDDEGCADFRPDSRKRNVRGYQKDVAILDLVKDLLWDFGIKSRLVLPNEVVISGKENLVKFSNEINFSGGVCINGGRSNSVWKEHLEKREILARAIESYKI